MDFFTEEPCVSNWTFQLFWYLVHDICVGRGNISQHIYVTKSVFVSAKLLYVAYTILLWNMENALMHPKQNYKGITDLQMAILVV